MKPIDIPEELFQKILDNNNMIEKTIDEYDKYIFLSNQISYLKKSKIIPCHEMRGKGLRETYVSMGKDWLEESFILRWRKENELIKKDIKLRKIKNILVTTLSFLFFVSSITFYSYTLYDGIKPGFGDEMKTLHSGDILLDDMSRFANSIFKEIDNGSDRFSFWSDHTPPELKALWSNSLVQFKNCNSLHVKNVFIDPEREGVFHIQCNANIANSDKVQFRLQCKKENNKFLLLALE